MEGRCVAVYGCGGIPYNYGALVALEKLQSA